MSIDISFEIVSKPEHIKTIKEIPENTRFVKKASAKNWEKDVGTLCTYKYKALDSFYVGELMFGKRPESITYGIDHRTFYFEDGTKGIIDEKSLEPFYRDKTSSGYLYKINTIGYLDHPYFFNEITKEGPVSDYMLNRLIDAVLEEGGNYYAEDLLVIMRAKRALERGETVVCRKE